MPSLLFISPVKPYPTGNGLAMRAAAVQQALGRMGDLQTLVVPVADSEHAQTAAGETSRNARSWLGYERGRALLSQVPELPWLARWAAPAHGESIDPLDEENGFDLVYLLRLYTAGVALPLMNRWPGARFVLDVDEDDSAVFRQIARLQAEFGQENQAAKSLAEAGRLQGFARQVLPWFDHVACATEVEAAALQEKFEVGVLALPNVISPVSQAAGSDKKNSSDLLFLGNLDYFPNRDALNLLLTEIFPGIRQALPGTRLVVAGRGSDDLRHKHENDRGVNWLGYVDELGPLYRRARLCIVPLRIGGGSRLKLLEAFEHGLPVVASRKAAEGLEVKSGEHLLIADCTQDTIAAVRQILENPGLAETLTGNARRYVRSNHLAANLEKKMRELLC